MLWMGPPQHLALVPRACDQTWRDDQKGLLFFLRADLRHHQKGLLLP